MANARIFACVYLVVRQGLCNFASEREKQLKYTAMEIKKSEKASLENKRLLFTEIGLVVALLIVYIGFNWSSRDASVAALEDTTKVLVEEELNLLELRYCSVSSI